MKKLAYILIALMISISFVACGGSGDNSAETGSLFFRLAFSDYDPTREGMTGDVCVDNGVAKVGVKLFSAAGNEEQAQQWPCALHQGLFENVAVGTGYYMGFNGLDAADEVIYHALHSNIDVTAGQTEQLGTIEMQPVDTSDTTPPSVPGNVTAAAVSSSQIDISWTASTDDSGVQMYNLYRDGEQISAPTAMSFSDTGLTAGTNYCYSVSANDAAMNESAQSAQVCTMTHDAAPTADTTPPTVPGDFSVNAISSTQIDLSWSASTDDTGVFQYAVQDTAGGTIESVSTTYYSHTGLAPATQYCYQVSARDDAGNVSPPSAQACATTQSSTPPPPTGGDIPTDGLMAYYPFNGNANDESGNGNNGTVNNATLTVDRNNTANSAYSFIGTDTSSIVASLNSMKSSAIWTFSAWSKTNSLTPKGAPFCLVSDNAPNFSYGFWWGFWAETQMTKYRVNDSINGEYGFDNTSANPTLNVWEHHTFVIEQTNLKHYINGQEVYSASIIFNPTNISYNLNLHIGRGTAYSSSNNYNYDGVVDDVRIYNRALTATEIQALYNE